MFVVALIEVLLWVARVSSLLVVVPFEIANEAVVIVDFLLRVAGASSTEENVCFHDDD